MKYLFILFFIVLLFQTCSKKSKPIQLDGIWNFTGSEEGVNKELTISNTNDSSFDFQISAVYGQNDGAISGTAKIKSAKNEKHIKRLTAFADVKEETIEDICKLSFLLYDDTLEIQADNCISYAGLNVTYDGFFVKSQISQDKNETSNQNTSSNTNPDSDSDGKFLGVSRNNALYGISDKLTDSQESTIHGVPVLQAQSHNGHIKVFLGGSLDDLQTAQIVINFSDEYEQDELINAVSQFIKNVGDCNNCMDKFRESITESGLKGGQEVKNEFSLKDGKVKFMLTVNSVSALVAFIHTNSKFAEN